MTQRTIAPHAARIIALLIAVIFLPCFTARGESPSKTSDDLATEFKDKIVLQEVNRSNALETKSGSVVLVKLRITKLGNRDFLVGTGYAPEEGESSWYKDVLVGVPCESILRFHAMTPKQFADYMKTWKDRSDK